MCTAIADHELIAIRWRFRDAQRTESAAGAGWVLHDDVLAQFLGQALCDNAPRHVARATCGERHHQRERPTWKTLRGGCFSKREKCENMG